MKSTIYYENCVSKSTFDMKNLNRNQLMDLDDSLVKLWENLSTHDYMYGKNKKISEEASRNIKSAIIFD
ncbi:hypothetical protein C8N28_1043 [Albibacterium bauzanense]|uniref:Uncharacterized protein n=1 Tax=Albibacterium bauzanense TaxID=653929 RepID=A0A4V2PYE7_9SPHI|nr:hypothetical protein C8N28_1043 [Albibacterium bauzanense]